MEIIKINAMEDIVLEGTSIACIGYFDGVHLGHQKLIDSVLELANNQYIPAVICFDNDPHVIMHKVSEARYITPFKERLRVLEKKGIQRCFLLHFDEMMLHMHQEAFISQILEKLQLHTLICGKDFHFAYRGEGDINSLQNRSFDLHIVFEMQYRGKKISSSTIEKLIEAGKMIECSHQLGRFFSIRGHIIHGANVGGSKLGFPTANLKMDEDYLIPKKGVYHGAVCVCGKMFKAMINVGNNPTMNYQQQTSIEAHIIDFDEDIYGVEVIFYFYDYLREEQKFASVEALITQLKHDIQIVRNR